MRLGAIAYRVTLGLMLVLGGCASRSSDPDTDPLRGDLLGYYEYRDQGAVYVLGSIGSLDAARAGKPPATTAAGFSAQGQHVLFETDKAGMTQRLMAEYDRRHGATR
jgi:hypothetical protein